MVAQHQVSMGASKSGQTFFKSKQMELVKNDCRSKWDWSHFLQEHVEYSQVSAGWNGGTF